MAFSSLIMLLDKQIEDGVTNFKIKFDIILFPIQLKVLKIRK